MPRIEKVLTFVEENNYSLAYGLAPNPWGFSFCYEGEKKSCQNLNKKLDTLLNDLTKEEEEKLRKKYF